MPAGLGVVLWGLWLVNAVAGFCFRNAGGCCAVIQHFPQLWFPLHPLEGARAALGAAVG